MAQTADGAKLQTTVQMMVIILGTINKVDRAAGAGVTARAEKMLRDSATSRMQLSASSQPMLASTSQHSCAQLRTVQYVYMSTCTPAARESGKLWGRGVIGLLREMNGAWPRSEAHGMRREPVLQSHAGQVRVGSTP
jgi:hypothetical protein